MKILKINAIYLATTVVNGSIKSNMVVARGARLVEKVMTGELIPLFKIGSIREVSSC